MTKIPPDDVLECLYKLRIRGSDQLNTVQELNDMEIHQKISMPDCQKLKTGGEEKHRSARNLLSVESKKVSVREDTTVMSVQNQHQKPLHPLSHNVKEVEVRREKRTSEAGVHQGSSIDSRAKPS